MKAEKRKQLEEVLKTRQKLIKEKVKELAKEKSSKKKRFKTSYLVNKIIYFCEMLANTKFYPYQKQFAKRMIECILDRNPEEIVTALFSRQSGKSYGVAMVTSGCAVILPTLANLPQFEEDERFNYKFTDPDGTERYFGYRNGFWVGIFAPKKEQSGLTYNKIRGIMEASNADDILSARDINIEFTTNNGNTVSLSNGSFVATYSASETAHIEGPTLHVAILEECQEISSYKINKSIMPMLANTGGIAVMVGTAYNYKGVFYEVIQENKKLFAQTGLKNHFEYNYKEIQKYNPLYIKHVEAMKRRSGGGKSDEFRMNYELEWILERGMYITEIILKKMRLKDYAIVYQKYGGNQIAGIDIGKQNDSTVVTVLDKVMESRDENGNYKKIVLAWLELYGDNYDLQYHDVYQFLSNFSGLEKIVIDSTGVGDPIADRLITTFEPHVKVMPLVMTPKSKDDIFKHLSIDIQAGRLFYPANDLAQEEITYINFEQQMLDAEKEFNRGFLNVTHPAEKGAHDDYIYSLALANYGAVVEEENMPEIEESFSPISIFSGRSMIVPRRRVKA